jgi:hypothetical protein
MQHGRNMKTGFSQIDLYYRYDDIVEDMLVGIDATTLHPRDAMDVSEIVAAVNAERKVRGQELVSLPPAIHLQINEYAKHGMYKGKGPAFPRPHSALKKQFIEAWQELAKERKEALQKSGEFAFSDGTVGTIRNKLEALDQAAIETARAMRADGLKRKPSTVKREMSKRR